jgi:hypothetical protein
MNLKLWTEEYHQDLINRKIKHEIEMYFFSNYERKPTFEEFHEWFDKFVKNASCVITNADLGIYDDDETKWYQTYESKSSA